MKRIIPLILAVSLVFTLFAGLSVSAADVNDEYVYDFTKIQVEGSQVSHDPAAGDGYATVTSADDAGDPYFFINHLTVPSTQKVVVVKYATESLSGNNLYVSASKDGSAPYDVDWGATGGWIPPAFITDGEWHLAVYDIPSQFPAVGDLLITTFRVPGAEAGKAIKVAYIGFFTSEEEALAYDEARSAGSGDSDSTETPAGPTETPDVSATGDNNAVSLFVLVMAAAASALCIAVTLRKRSYKG